MSEFEEVYNPDSPKASAEFEVWWQKSGDPHLMNRTSGESFRYVYWMCHTAYGGGKAAAHDIDLGQIHMTLRKVWARELSADDGLDEIERIVGRGQ